MLRLILRGGFEKKHPYYQGYDFIVHRYSSLYDMLNFKNPIGSYELSIVE